MHRRPSPARSASRKPGHIVDGRSSRILSRMHVIKQLFGSAEPCGHLQDFVPAAQANQCQECGSRFNVRLCATCGHVGCCDSQAGHARTHANQTSHPVIYANPQGGGFAWCYAHNSYL